MKEIIVFILLLISLIATADTTINVSYNDEDGLAEAIMIANSSPDNQHIINIVDSDGFAFVITKSLPAISGKVKLNGVIQNGKEVTFNPIATFGGTFLKVENGGELEVNNVRSIANFRSNNPGAGFFVDGFSILRANHLSLDGNVTQFDGGGVFCGDNSQCFFYNVDFNDNQASNSGGAVSCQGQCSFQWTDFSNNHADDSGGGVDCTGNCDFNNTRFWGNSSDIFACVVNVPFPNEASIENSIITDPVNLCGTNYFDINGGNLTLRSVYVESDKDSDVASCTGDCKIDGSVFKFNAGFSLSQKSACNDFGTGAFSSLGHNLDSTDGCFFDQASDLVNTNPLVNIDSDGIPQPQNNSPLIESGKSTLINADLPCGYKDMNGLGRPQDFDGDGVFSCDRGPVELQAGDDLDLAQSGLFYDVDRSGEGIIIEMLNQNTALVTMFTYHPNQTDLMWLIGVGTRVGNTIVIDNLQRTSGGVFGASFNPENIVRTDIGGMSLIFPDCNASDNPGRLTFQAGFEFANELENMLVKSQRLTRLLECDNLNQNNTLIGRSGSFYDPNRSGEGVFVELLENGTAVIIIYTYTPTGKQFWAISSATQIVGNTITANMLYPASTTGFGSQFDAKEIDLQPWGTISLEYQPGCNQLNYGYNSSVNGFGSGNYVYSRLTQPAGTTCDL